MQKILIECDYPGCKIKDEIVINFDSGTKEDYQNLVDKYNKNTSFIRFAYGRYCPDHHLLFVSQAFSELNSKISFLIDKANTVTSKVKNKQISKSSYDDAMIDLHKTYIALLVNMTGIKANLEQVVGKIDFEAQKDSELGAIL